MHAQHKLRPYTAPTVLESVQVLLEQDLLKFGSIVDWAAPVETAGLENGGYFNYESGISSESTFNHQWE